VSKARDITGQRYGRLVAIRRAESLNGKTRWECQCDCGNKCTVETWLLTSEKTKSCGCLRQETARQNGKRGTTHGMTGSRIWRIWQGMKQRCMHHPCYENVSVCEEWLDFEGFYEWALTSGYSDELTIDRIDVNGNYAPDNCRWATYKQQENNRTNNVFITIDGQRKPVTEWAALSGIASATLKWRVNNGWPESDLLIPANLNNANLRRNEK